MRNKQKSRELRRRAELFSHFMGNPGDFSYDKKLAVTGFLPYARILCGCAGNLTEGDYEKGTGL